MTLQELLALMNEHEVRRVDLRVTDLLGRWQHFTIPPSKVDEELLEHGNGFDGSSLRGFQSIEASDMLLMPDIDTAVIDPIPEMSTVAIICDVADPLTRERYTRDPRYVATKAAEYLKTTGIADEASFGPELEFFIFDDVRFQQGTNTAFYFVDSSEASWNTGLDERAVLGHANLGYKIPGKQGYSPTPPFDDTADLRAEIVAELNGVGIGTFVDHHEVATAGQAEIGVDRETLVNQADRTQWYKYLVRNVARRHGRVATFMPKPIYGDNGSGMHVHQSLWKDGTPLFFDSNGYAGLSHMARYYIGGLLRHAGALMAFCAPTTNSYKRLVPGYEAPVNLVYSVRNRSAAIRIPTYRQEPAHKRLEFRPPDATANAYLAFSAMLMAGLDGIQNEIDPGDPVDRDIYALSPEEAQGIPTVPGSLGESLDALEADQSFLLQGDVFTQDAIDTWMEFKRGEVDELAFRPTPWEYERYFGD